MPVDDPFGFTCCAGGVDDFHHVGRRDGGGYKPSPKGQILDFGARYAGYLNSRHVYFFTENE